MNEDPTRTTEVRGAGGAAAPGGRDRRGVCSFPRRLLTRPWPAHRVTGRWESWELEGGHRKERGRPAERGGSPTMSGVLHLHKHRVAVLPGGCLARKSPRSPPKTTIAISTINSDLETHLLH